MAVIRTRAKPPHGRPDLVMELAKEIKANSQQRGAGIPDVYEEEQTFGSRLHVIVVWDRWTDVPHVERGPIILDAYREAKGEREMLRITLPLGMTPEEFARRQPQQGA